MIGASGSDLAKALKDAAFPGTNPGHWARQEHVSVEDVLVFVDAQNQPSAEEAAIVSRGIESFDAYHDRALARLCGEFDRQGGSLTLKGLNSRQLSGVQAAALIEARALLEAVEEVEFAFRDWITDGQALTIRKLAIWDLAGAKEPDIARLSQVIANSSPATLARNIFQHHQHLSKARGAPSWEPGSDLPAARQRVLPDFTLVAFKRLFAEGVHPHVDA